MTNPQPPTPDTGPTAAIVDFEGIRARYGIGKTKANELVCSAGFPHSVVPGMHRYPLEAIKRWELATALEGTIAKGHDSQSPILISPPEPARRGPRPNRKKAA